MSLDFLGRKLGMSQIFTEQGERVPVTVLRVGPCVVVQKKTADSEGYSAVQLGYEECKQKHTSKPMAGHFHKAGVSPRRYLFEVRVPAEAVSELEIGQELRCAENFEVGARVDVSGVTKGRGFTGVIRRWGFKTSVSTHGTHEFFRHGGALSAGTYPGRIPRGKKMAGHYGNENVTVSGLAIERVDAERNLLFLRGGVPGHTNGLVRISTSTRS